MRAVICFIFILGAADIYVLGGMLGNGPSNYWQSSESGDNYNGGYTSTDGAYSGGYTNSYTTYSTYYYYTPSDDYYGGYTPTDGAYSGGYTNSYTEYHSDKDHTTGDDYYGGYTPTDGAYSGGYTNSYTEYHSDKDHTTGDDYYGGYTPTDGAYSGGYTNSYTEYHSDKDHTTGDDYYGGYTPTDGAYSGGYTNSYTEYHSDKDHTTGDDYYGGYTPTDGAYSGGYTNSYTEYHSDKDHTTGDDYYGGYTPTDGAYSGGYTNSYTEYHSDKDHTTGDDFYGGYTPTDGAYSGGYTNSYTEYHSDKDHTTGDDYYGGYTPTDGAYSGGYTNSYTEYHSDKDHTTGDDYYGGYTPTDGAYSGGYTNSYTEYHSDKDHTTGDDYYGGYTPTDGAYSGGYTNSYTEYHSDKDHTTGDDYYGGYTPTDSAYSGGYTNSYTEYHSDKDHTTGDDYYGGYTPTDGAYSGGYTNSYTEYHSDKDHTTGDDYYGGYTPTDSAYSGGYTNSYTEYHSDKDHTTGDDYYGGYTPTDGAYSGGYTNSYTEYHSDKDHTTGDDYYGGYTPTDGAYSGGYTNSYTEYHSDNDHTTGDDYYGGYTPTDGAYSGGYTNSYTEYHSDNDHTTGDDYYGGYTPTDGAYSGGYTNSYTEYHSDNDHTTGTDDSGSTPGYGTLWSSESTHYSYSFDMSNTDYSTDDRRSTFGDDTLWSSESTHYSYSFDMSDTDYSLDSSGSSYGDSMSTSYMTQSFYMSDTYNSWDLSGSSYSSYIDSTSRYYDMSDSYYSSDDSGSTSGYGTLWSSESTHYSHSFDMSDTVSSSDDSGSTSGYGTLWSSESMHYSHSFDMSDTVSSSDDSGSTSGYGTLWSSESMHYSHSFDMSDTVSSSDDSGSTSGYGTLWSSESMHYSHSFDMSDTVSSSDDSGSTSGYGTLWSSESMHYSHSFDMSDTVSSSDDSGSTSGYGTLWSSESMHYSHSFDMSDTVSSSDDSGSISGYGTLWSSESTHYTYSFDMSDTVSSLDGSGSSYQDSMSTSHMTYSSSMLDTYNSVFYDDSTITGDTFSTDYMTSFPTYSSSSTTGYINPTSTSFYTDMSMSSSDYYGNVPDDLTSLNVSFTSGVEMVGSIPKVALYCTFETSPLYEYEITWLADDVVVYTSGKMPYDTVGSFFVTRDHLDISGFALDKSYKCGVNVYNLGGSNSILSVYSEEERPVEFSTRAVEFLRGESATFNISVNIPLPCPEESECYLDIKLFDPDEVHDCYDCGLAFINTHTCGQRIFGSLNYSGNVGVRQITMTTKNNQFYYLKSNFRFRVRFDISSDVEDFWSGTFTQEFSVTVSDDNAEDWLAAYCYATNDPRMRSFDKVRYNLMEVGQFIMYQHTEYEAEVQITTEYCMWAGTCACGVQVRAGKDVFVIDHCYDTHFTNFTHTSGNRHLYAIRYYGNFYVIYLPHGTVVYVGVSPRTWFPFTMLNVFIFPSPADISKVKGLCGTLNDNSDDDFTHRDDSITPVSYGWPWWPLWQTTDPNDFIESWRVTAEEDLMNPDISTEDLNDWNEDNKCVCPGSDGSGSVMCSTQEQRLCNTQSLYGGAEISRRSVNHRLRSRLRKAREIEENVLDRSTIRRRLKLREERSAAIPATRAKRQAEGTVSCDFETAYNICANSMASSCGSFMDTESGGSENSTDAIIDCALDKQVNCTVNWEDSACSVVVSTLENTVGRNNSLDADEVDELLSKICPNQCCGHGSCANGVCSCDNNYAMDDCGLDRRELVEVTLEGSGENVMCNKPCIAVQLVLSGIIEEAQCKLSHYVLTLPNNTITYMGESVQTINYFNTYEGECVIPNQRRRRSVSSGSSEAIDIYQTSVSNDGTNYGSSVSVIILDSTCLTYSGSGVNVTATLSANYCLIEGTCYFNGTSKTGQACLYCDADADAFGWTLTTDYCLIDNECYMNGTLNSGDACKFCHVSLDTSDWTDDNETASCQVTSSDGGSGMEGYVVAIIVLAVLLGLVCVGGISYVIYRKWKHHKTFSWKNRGLFDQVGNPKFLRHATLEQMDDNGPRLEKLHYHGAEETPKWKISTGLHGGIKKPNFLLQTEASTMEPTVNPSERGMDNRNTIPTLVLPQNVPEGGLMDHPPPVYKVYSDPKPGTEKTPTNLYTERGSTDLSREPSPVEASSMSRRMSTGHMTPEVDVERATTPTMPDIGH